MTDLNKSITDMTPEEHDAELKRFSDVESGWFAELDALTTSYEVLRVALADPTYATIDRQVAIDVCNFVEKTRVMTHFIVSIGTRNIEAMRNQLRMAGCAFCGWSYKAEDVDILTGGLDREFTKEEMQAVQDRITAAIREHITVCPNHPMRAMEQQLRERA